MSNAYKRKNDPSLVKIVFVIIVLLAVAWGGWTLFRQVDLGAMSGTDASSVRDNLAAAKDLYDQGDFAGARKALEELASGAEGSDVAPQALMLLAHLDAAEGVYAAAQQRLKDALEQFPDSSHQPEVAIEYARVLESSGRFDEAAQRYEEVMRTASPNVRTPALVGLGRQAERSGDLEKARDLYRQAVDETEFDSEIWNEAVDGLGRVNVALIFSPQPTSESKVYEVASGDSINSIGNALNTTQGLLIRANRLEDPTRLNIGQRLKYTPKDFRIVIERSTCRLFLLDKDGIFKCYRTGLGRPGQETTLGHYKIGNKQKDPTWFKPGSGPIPPGDPNNELGTRWMPLVPVDESLPTDLGIHGTIAPETIGHYSSSGCPRMHKADVEELYDLVVRATPVDIVDVYDSKQPITVAGG